MTTRMSKKPNSQNDGIPDLILLDTPALDEDEEITDPAIPRPIRTTAATPPNRPPQPAPQPIAQTPPNTQPQSAAPAQPAAQPQPVAPPQSSAQRPPRAPVRMPDLGLIDPFMKDPEITEIMVNDTRNIMIEKNGRMSIAGFAFPGIDELNRLVRSVLDITGRIISPDSPYLDTMLPDGSRVNIVAPPLTLHGPCVTIRKFPAKTLGIDDLIQSEMLDKRIAHFVSLCVTSRLNILVSGGTGSGKTTLLNVLMSFVPRGERLLTIEDTPELQVPHINSVRLQTKPQTPASAPVHARELLANALRMRPDRIIVGECRRAEAFDMLQAMNTGHEGSMTTLHANSPRDALSRLETLCMMAGVELPLLAIRKQIESALDLVIQTRRSRNGKRRVIGLSEVTGMEGETITLQDIFVFEPDSGSSGGTFRFTGFVPTFIHRFREYGIELPKNYFT